MGLNIASVIHISANNESLKRKVVHFVEIEIFILSLFDCVEIFLILNSIKF